MKQTDYLIIGSGIAGLSFAIKAARTGTVALVTKRAVADCATNRAQGGVASVWSPNDSFSSHIDDTLVAGAGLCHADTVNVVVREGPDRIRELIDWGVNFTLDPSSSSEHPDYELGLEGGHSYRRILHAGDFTGSEIERVLAGRARVTPNLTIYESHIAIDLITTGKIERKFAGPSETCWGAYVLDIANNRVETFLAKTVVIATGGAGKVYRYTSSPDISTGDGMAMAWRCGATMANMEFVQFHPTCLYHPKAKNFLISEALRGEGAVLRLKDGSEFMAQYHPKKELAPRDIVARAIDNELKKSGQSCVYLDITHRPARFIIDHFPTIYQKCLEFGIDMTKEPVPVVPAAHYFCGGIQTNEHGETSIGRLFAIGEAACTGLHGANRLASNSLLEALVFAERACNRSRTMIATAPPFPAIPAWDSGSARDSDEQVVISQNWEEIRYFMWNYVGIVRSNKRLSRAVRRIELLQQEISEYYWNFTMTADLIELRNIATVAELIVRSAQKRRESRGLHYNLDFPEIAAVAADTLMNRFS